jgi:methionine-rich copper-binding protein CopC
LTKKSKTVTMRFSAAVLAMAVMLATQEAEVKRVTHEKGLDLKFNFAAKQQFMVTIQEGRIVAASLTLVEGREPTTQAMVAVDDETEVDTVKLFAGLESNNRLEVEVVSDDGFSLDKASLCIGDVSSVNTSLGVILFTLLELDVSPEVNAGDHIVEFRQNLTNRFRDALAA